MSFDPKSLAVPGVQGLTPYEPGKPIEALERELGIRDSVKLASNENPLGPSPRAVEAMRQGLGAVAMYPDGNATALKAALAERHGVTPAQITLGNGSNDVLELLARTFLGPGRSAAYSAHAFAVYPLVTQAVGAEARVAAANSPAHEMPYGHDLGALSEAVDETTRVVFVANPNNPTGTWLEADALRAFIAGLPASTLVVVDEAYYEYAQTPGYANALEWLAAFPNLMVTRTFSKIYGLAGIRCGYGVSSPEIAELLNRVRQPFNVSALAQCAARAALDDLMHLQDSLAVNRAGLEQLASGLASRGLVFPPSAANFVCVDVGQRAAPVYERLLREGVIVRPMGGYALPQHLRITIGREAENARVIDALDKALAR